MDHLPAAARNKEPARREKKAPRLRIRLYRHGLGDCLLLRFARSDGRTSNILIDCGLIMSSSDGARKMREVADDIAKACEQRLDIVVMTHEHWDHASGFSAQQAREIFEGIAIDEVWYGWTEDPQCELGIKLRNERAAKVSALAHACKAIAIGGLPADQERAKALGAVLGFFGPEAKEGKGIGKTRDAFDYPKNRKGVKTRFCYPDSPPLTLPGIENVRVYVLGPPLDEARIKKSTPSRTAREVYELGADARLTGSLGAAFLRKCGGTEAAGDDDCPFPSARLLAEDATREANHRLSALLEEVWEAQDDAWRKIDDDWTQSAETLALNLDAHTNNTSVVLAFEFTDTGEVFLFPGDAQVGSWLSWQELAWSIKDESGVTEVAAKDLLRRTVFYKVGHHGSHNATLRELGLEQMQSADLLAFIPVIEEEAKTNRWNNMPFGRLVTRLEEKTGNRVLRSDQDPSPEMRDSAKLVHTPLYFELSFG